MVIIFISRAKSGDFISQTMHSTVWVFSLLVIRSASRLTVEYLCYGTANCCEAALIGNDSGVVSISGIGYPLSMILLESVDRFVGTALHHSFLSLISVVICYFRFRVGPICSQMVVFMFTDGTTRKCLSTAAVLIQL